MKKILLNENWKLKRIKTGEIFEIKLPASVFSVLKEKLFDPYYRDNQDRVLEILREDFEFYCNFEADTSLLEYKKVFLSLQVDTISDVYLNENKLVTTSNMHRPYKVEIRNLLNEGKNELRILIHSPLPYIEEKQKKLKLYGVKEAISGYPYLRKAHYMFGWDWGMQLPDMGIYEIPFLEGFSGSKIKSVNFNQRHLKDRVILSFNAEIENFTEDNFVLRLVILSPSGAEFEYEKPARINTFFQIEIDRPFLWWPANYGPQHLYRIRFELKKNEKIIDAFERKIGLREARLVRKNDNYGESFYFEVNGVPIFAKGANYIPEDHIIPLISKDRTLKLLKDCVDANFNMLRVWGGGFYPFEWFYEICDELGLMIWQDFMFACSQYPYDDNFIGEVRKEIMYNVDRLKFHPSIVMWCGNNEIEEAWVYWGIPQNRKLKNTYLRIFEKEIPRILKKLDPDRPYWPSSPSSRGRFYNPRKEEMGDSHYWDVWHNLKPFEDYRNHNFRFVSEFGFQSFPSIKTINNFTEYGDRNIFSWVMEKHQKNSSANGKIIYYLSQYYMFPKDFYSLIYLSQLLQAEAIKYGVEHFRIKRNICMGSLYWQLNDCWPVASWSSIDYYGYWKALHYFAKRFYSPILVACDKDENEISVYVINDTLESKEFTLQWKFRTFNGNLISEGEKIVLAEKLSSTKLLNINFRQYLDNIVLMRSAYFECFLNDNKRIISRNFEFFSPPKYFIWQAPEISMDFFEDERNYYISLLSSNFVKALEISFRNFDAILSDNYFELSPHSEYVVSISKASLNKEVSLKDIKNNIKLFSLWDSFASN